MRKTPDFQTVTEVLKDEVGDNTGSERIVLLSVGINHRTDSIGGSRVCVLQEYSEPCIEFERDKETYQIPSDQKHWCAHVESDVSGLGGRVLEVSNGLIRVGVRHQDFPSWGIVRLNTTITSVMEVKALAHRGLERNREFRFFGRRQGRRNRRGGGRTRGGG